MDSGLESDQEAIFGDTEGENEFEAEYDESGTEGEEEEELEGLPLPEPSQPVEEEPELAEKVYRTKRDNFLDFHNVKDLVNFLSKIELVWPEDLPFYNQEEFKADPKHINFPPSFYECSPKEKVVFWHADNFRQQFLHKYPQRRPPFIAPKNECDCQKVFSTFIQPAAALGYPECYQPELCVKYFKDYFSPQILEPVPDPPTRIRSHVSVLKDRQANAFEQSIVIVSVLLGAGYNAYVVDGYASKEVTTMCGRQDFKEETLDKLDYFSDKAKLKKRAENGGENGELAENEKEEIVRPVSPSKYRVKPKKSFKSKYEVEMGEREETRVKEEERIRKEKEHEEWLKNQKPPTPDIMAGYRSHAWVLILPGIIPETGADGEPAGPYFLEVFTGTKREISDPNFHGIEAVFNYKNYWINLQPSAANCAELNYDLQDSACWAKLLYEPSTQKKEKESESISNFNDEEEEEIIIPEMYLDMPISWTTDLQISEEDYQRKFPGGKKMIEYNDAMVEVAAPFVNEDGLVKRIIKFSGKSRLPKNLLHIEEIFDKRKDGMNKRIWYKKGRVVHEQFDKGRKDALKEHIHVSGRNKAHYPRHLYYYSNAHPEGVYHRQVVHKGLVEHFENRHDFLYYRFIAFGGVLCRTMQPKDAKSKTKVFVEFVKGDAARKRPRRKIIGIIEKYHRNPNKEADDDIAEKHMLIEEGKFRILFHYGDENYTRRSIEFFKAVKGIKKESVDFKPEDCIEFRVDPFSSKTPMYQKYMILKQLQADQIKSHDKAREAEDEVYQTVTNRVQEDWRNELELDYSSQSKEEEKARKKEMDSEDEIDLSGIDFASPYLEQMVPKNKEEELALKQFILQNAKDRIIRQAEHIIRSYQDESSKLRDILKTAPSVKDEMEAQHQGFATYYDRVLCKMHIMEQRLLRLRAKAPGDYCSLLIKVLQHPLLNKYTAEDKLEKQRKLIEALLPPPEEKKLDHVSCCRLDYVFKYVEKKKQPDEQETEISAEDQQPALMIIPPDESTHEINET